MLARLLPRILPRLTTLAIALLLGFVLAAHAPGDAFSDLELDPAISPHTLASLRARYAPDQPVGQRLTAWLGAASHGDMGYSFTFHRPVTTLLRERTPSTARLVILAWLLAWSLGVGLAGWAVLSRSTAGAVLRSSLVLATSALASLPLAMLAIAALLWAPVQWLPSLLMAPDNTPTWPWLPAAVLALAFLPLTYLQCANALALAWEKDFVLTALSQGHRPRYVLWRHAFPNTWDTLLPLAALTFAQLLADAVIVETLLNWPGIGQLAVTAVTEHDVPLVAGLVLLTSVVVVATNMLADFLQFLSNPRLRMT